MEDIFYQHPVGLPVVFGSLLPINRPLKTTEAAGVASLPQGNRFGALCQSSISFVNLLSVVISDCTFSHSHPLPRFLCEGLSYIRMSGQQKLPIYKAINIQKQEKTPLCTPKSSSNNPFSQNSSYNVPFKNTT